jgi:hypothetical protein
MRLRNLQRSTGGRISNRESSRGSRRRLIERRKKPRRAKRKKKRRVNHWTRASLKPNLPSCKPKPTKKAPITRANPQKEKPKKRSRKLKLLRSPNRTFRSRMQPQELRPPTKLLRELRLKI